MGLEGSGDASGSPRGWGGAGPARSRASVAGGVGPGRGAPESTGTEATVLPAVPRVSRGSQRWTGGPALAWGQHGARSAGLGMAGVGRDGGGRPLGSGWARFT